MSHRFEVIEDDCIGCGLCAERAPENFAIPSGSRIARVSKQPETFEEEQACLEATDYCPMGGLHADPALVPGGDSTPADITAPTASGTLES